MTAEFALFVFLGRVPAKKAVGIALAVAMISGLASCDRREKDMQGIAQRFQQVDSARQKGVRSDALVKTMRSYPAYNVTWCGDSKTVVSTSGGQTNVFVWDGERGEIVDALSRAVRSGAIACSADARFVASAYSDCNKAAAVRVWELNKGREASTDLAGPFPGIDGQKRCFSVRSLSFDQADKRLYAAFSNGAGEYRLAVYEVPSWNTVREIALPGGVQDTQPVVGVKGRLYAYVARSLDVVVIDPVDGVERYRFRAKLLPSVLAFGRDDNSVFVGGTRRYDRPKQGMPEQVVEEYSLFDGKLLRSIVTGHVDGLTGLGVRADSDLLITASVDKTIELRRAGSGALVSTLGDKTTPIQSMAVRPDGRQIASGGTVLNIWSLP